MKFKLRPAIAGLPGKTAVLETQGLIGKKAAVFHKNRDGLEECLQERIEERPLGQTPSQTRKRLLGTKALEETAVEEGGKEPQATVGASMGFTIPGPKGTYLSARIDAWCFLPTAANAEQIQQTYGKCSKLIQDQLADAAEIAQEFLEALAK